MAGELERVAIVIVMDVDAEDMAAIEQTVTEKFNSPDRPDGASIVLLRGREAARVIRASKGPL